ncbi:MAG: hypothetical protein ACK6DS_03470 [Planctomycetota bacterium]
MISPLQFLPLAEFVFERQATLPIVLFEIFVLVGAAFGCWILSKLFDKLWLRLLITGAAVFIFELFTGPMWVNERMGPWAYLYLDLSWILTLGWSVLILGVVTLVDTFLPRRSQTQRFFTYLAILLPVIVVLEITVVNLGLRSYSPEVLNSTCGVILIGAPIEILFYVPVFISLIITFYKYWSFVLDGTVDQSTGPRNWLRSVAIALVGVFLFELMIEPMIENRNLPSWSYVFNDISILLTGSWVLLLAFGAVVVERVFAGFPAPLRFIAAVLLVGFVALVVESWMTLNGFRVYGPSMVACFTGFRTPITGLPSEIAFAIPCYLSLIIAFIRFWEIVWGRRN